MPINVQCTGCGGKFRAPDELAGKQVKCPKCSVMILVSTSEQQHQVKPPASVRKPSQLSPAIIAKAAELPEGSPSRVFVWALVGGSVITLFLLIGLISLINAIKSLTEKHLIMDAQVNTSKPSALSEKRNPNQLTTVTSLPPSPPAVELTENQKLLAALVSRAEEADANSKHFIYKLALRYSPGDAEILAKLKDIPGGIDLTEEERHQMISAIGMCVTEDLVEWKNSVAKMETTELQILLDKDLVGGLRYTNFNLQGVTAHIFVAKPKATVSQVLDRYGKPSEERKTSLTYGSIRLIVDKGRVAAVVFPPR